MAMVCNLQATDSKIGEVANTVNPGRKWWDLVQVGETINLYVTKDLIGTAKVLDMQLKKFDSLTNFDIAQNHRASIRDYASLYADMEKTYGPEFSGESECTIIWYRRLT